MDIKGRDSDKNQELLIISEHQRIRLRLDGLAEMARNYKEASLSGKSGHIYLGPYPYDPVWVDTDKVDIVINKTTLSNKQPALRFLHKKDPDLETKEKFGLNVRNVLRIQDTWEEGIKKEVERIKSEGGGSLFEETSFLFFPDNGLGFKIIRSPKLYRGVLSECDFPDYFDEKYINSDAYERRMQSCVMIKVLITLKEIEIIGGIIEQIKGMMEKREYPKPTLSVNQN